MNMLLCLTTRDRQGEFQCQCNRLEVVLDALSSLAAEGTQILTAELIEPDSRIPLPVEVFDGQIFSRPIQALEKEWQQLLEAV